MFQIRLILFCIALKFVSTTTYSPFCTSISDDQRFDCFPENGANEKECVARGCCWRPAYSNVKIGIGTPYCYFPSNFPNYKIVNGKFGDDKKSFSIQKPISTFRDKEILNLTVDLYYDNPDAFRAKIYDPNNKRYEVPLNISTQWKKNVRSDIQISVSDNPFAIRIYRTSTQRLLLDTSVAPLIYADQFIQFSSFLPNSYIYGIGEHLDSFQHTTDWKRYTLWNRDVGPQENTNLYGSYPFYLCMEPDGKAHGFFFLNSNAMDIVLQPYPAITFTTIGGIIDFFFYAGPTPNDVISQHLKTIGFPFMPPYFTLGFHLCRYNYGNDRKLKKIIERNRAIGIPYDTQWTDIDTMDGRKDWTYDTTKFSNLPEIVKDLHDHGQHYINIIDPAISNTTGYLPFENGLQNNVFIKLANNKDILVGRVWPGSTVFPDFTNPNATKWWTDVAQKFHDQIPFDGLWIDMNEPSNFIDGSYDGCTQNSYDEPAYLPNILGGKLYAKTICPSAIQYLSNHYNLHNLYAHFEAISTNYALRSINKNKRPFVLSRASFTGTGVYSAHWTGDVRSDWKNLYYSIPGILNFNMFGIPMVGADICGFAGDTTEELCIRWMQLGSFYPFMRNHNDDQSIDQDPGAFSTTAQAIMKSALETRYAFLPYLYTLFYRSTTYGETVVRPLLFEYPTDTKTHSIDRQYMFGPALMVSPVLDPLAFKVNAYFPNDTWYDIYNGELITQVQTYVDLDAPLSKINVHIRGGYIVPLQHPEVTTTQSRKNPFGLLVALNSDATIPSKGSLFWDDGESADSITNKAYNILEFTASEGQLSVQLDPSNAGYMVPMILDTVHVLGVRKAPSNVTINSNPNNNFIYDNTYQTLQIEYFSIDMFETRSLIIKWF